jgi:fructosamine-3-kinase
MASSDPQGLWHAIGEEISQRIGGDRHVRPLGHVSGGDIHRAVRIARGEQRFFVKLNDAARLTMFEGEARGLAEIAAASTLRTPGVIACGRWRDTAFLVLENLELHQRGDSTRFGEGLARMHAHRAERFGWSQDNHIGLTPQSNGWVEDWVEFWRERRMGTQLDLAARNGYGGRLQAAGASLMDTLHGLFDGYSPQPSLLHGDLWGGNYAYLADGGPVVFDPAVYYGDRETDLAMTELFGGFDAEFYAAYRAAWPLDPGYSTRRQLYQLYHVLNHLNLFGRGYLAHAQSLLDGLLAELSRSA